MTQRRKQVLVVVEEGAAYGLRLLEGALRYTETHPGIQLKEAAFTCGIPPKWLDRKQDCDGILLWASVKEQWAPRLLKSGLPAINACGGWPEELVETVAFSSPDIVKAALEHFSLLQRKTVAIVLYNLENEPVFLRYRDLFTTYATAMGLHPLTFDVGKERAVERKPPRLTGRGQQRLQTFLRRLPLPAAVWTMDDFMGYLVIEAARSIGLDIPGQLAVLGLGDYSVTRYCQPQLSSIPQPGELIGFEAMRILDAMMDGHPPAQRIISILPPPIVIRDSTRLTEPAGNPVSLAYQFISDQACQRITVDDVLRIAQMSLPTLHKRFMAAYNITPGAEIRRVKLERAQYHLRTTTLSIARIAELCGFDTQANFANFFKRETGQSPSRYRSNSKQ